ncbi:hypothetical protein ABW21_db0205183 [Orbilia brochopaga]|nr:hypothetical protein ABW21_db0205183 [Drechslerella brochopaga]
MRFEARGLLLGMLALAWAPEGGNCACQYDDVQSFQTCSTKYSAVKPRSVSFSTYTQFRTNGHAVTTTTTVNTVTVKDPRQATTITVNYNPTITSYIWTVSSGTTIWTSTISTTVTYTVYTPTTVFGGVATSYVTPAAITRPTSAGFTAVLNDPVNAALYNDLPNNKVRREAEADPISEPLWEPISEPMSNPMPAPVKLGRRASYPVLVVCKKIIKVTFVTTVVQTRGRQTVTIPGQTSTRSIEQPPSVLVYYTPSDAPTVHWTESQVTNIGVRTTIILPSTVTKASSTVTSTLPAKTVYAACMDKNRAPMPNELADFTYHIFANMGGQFSFRTNQSEYECCNACQARSDCVGSLWSSLQAWGAPCPWEPDGLCQPGEEPQFPPDLAQCDLFLSASSCPAHSNSFSLASPWDEAPKVVSNGAKCGYWTYSH